MLLLKLVVLLTATHLSECFEKVFAEKILGIHLDFITMRYLFTWEKSWV